MKIYIVIENYEDEDDHFPVKAFIDREKAAEAIKEYEAWVNANFDDSEWEYSANPPFQSMAQKGEAHHPLYYSIWECDIDVERRTFEF